jgi:type 1 glutamine amidotransferase/HEAT repeat protein
MQRRSGRTLLTLLALLCVCGALSPQVARAEIPAEAMAKIDAALPTTPVVNPQRERKLLVFSLCKGFAHSAVPYGEYAVVRLGETTGAYTATVSTDPAVFAPESLAQYDAVLFNNSTGTLFTDPVLRESLINFVHGGGGIVGIHAATDCFYDWPQFGEIMGGYFNGHPWNEEVTLKIDAPGHPVAAPLGREFVVADEIYQFKAPYSRENLRILASLDVSKTNMNKNGIHRDDGDFAVSWVRDYGEGRVFYCSLGHRHDIFWNKPILEHYLAGIQFAFGDLQADAAPSQASGAIEGDLAQALADAQAYTFGDSRLPLTVIERAVFAAADRPAQRRALEEELIGLLQGNVSYDVQAFVCRQLSLIGGDASVAAVSGLLADEKLSHMARYTLERLDSPAADEALRQALTDLKGDLRIGVINSLGQRGRRGAIEPLMALAERADEATAMALAEAVGRLGGLEGKAALEVLSSQARRSQSPARLDACYQAMARCAESLAAEGKLEEADAMYTRLHNSTMEMKYRLAGLRGLAMTSPLKTVPNLVRNISSETGVIRETSLQLVRRMPGETVTQVLAIQLGDLPFRAQADLIAALADRGDKAALPAITRRLTSGNRSVRQAAVLALGQLGDASSVPVLAALISQGSAEAQTSLERLRGNDVDTAIVAVMADTDAAGRVGLVRTLGARRAVGSVDALLQVAGSDESGEVRLAAYEVIGQLGGEEQMTACVRLLLGARQADERTAAGDAIIACCERAESGEAGAALLTRMLPEARPAAQGELLRVLGAIGGETALKAVRRTYAGADGEVADAAIRALAGWRDAGSAEDLLSVVVSGPERHREIAFAGYIRVVSLPSERPAAEDVRLYQRLLALAKTNQQIEQVLVALTGVAHPAVLDVAERYLDERGLRTAATNAILRVATVIGPDHERRALAAVEKVLEYAPADSALQEQAGQTIDAIQRNRGFITDFVYAGPFTKPQTNADAIFDTTFAPESAGFTGWRALPAGAISAPGRIDLNKIEAGSNCAGYLYVEIVSPTQQPARLQMGSDDGIKVWLNGEVVHSNNVARGLTLNSDTAMVTLKRGSNRLLLKIVQGGGGWEAACRLRSPEGFGLKDVTIRKPQ